MNNEFLRVLEYIEKEKGIAREVIIDAVKDSLVSAAKKSLQHLNDVLIDIHPQTGEIQVFIDKTVVSVVTDDNHEIILKEAKKINPDLKKGDQVRVEVSTPSDFGRIAAQTAKQVIIHKIKEAEKNVIFSEYKSIVGDLTSGIVRRMERNNIYIDLGKIEGVLTQKERCPYTDDEYKIGYRIRAFVKQVKNTPKGPSILLSRSCLGFVKKLMELEIPEIVEGVVQIKAMAREPGYRTKIAVSSDDPKVDPVGACVGMNGSRIKSIVRELNGEKIDIIRWDDKLSNLITNALHPAKLEKLVFFDNGNKAEIVVDEKQLPLVVGKKGHNIKLTVKLTGCKIDVKKSGSEEHVEVLAEENLTDDLKIEYLRKLSEAGISSVGDLDSIGDQKIAEVLGVDEAEAKKIKEAVQKFSSD